MKRIRGHRLDRAEAALAEARSLAARLRDDLRQASCAAHEAQALALSFWKQALEEFRSMALTSGEIVRRRGQYEKLVEHARQLRTNAGHAVDRCRAARRAVRLAQAAVVSRRKDAEKLALWCDAAAGTEG